MGHGKYAPKNVGRSGGICSNKCGGAVSLLKQMVHTAGSLPVGS